MRFLKPLLCLCLLLQVLHGWAEEAAKDTAPPKKFPIPSLLDQKDREKTIRDVFKDDFSKTAAADKLALVQKLTVQANDSTDDPAAVYELLALAQMLAAQAGNVDTVLTLGDKLAAHFDGDTHSTLKTNLGLVVSSVSDQKVWKLAVAFKTLLDKPDDAGANLLAGRYLVFTVHDFTRGLALLARSAHPALSQLAKLDMTNPDQPGIQANVGDAWWDLAEKTEDKSEKHVLLSRAGYWYGKAQPNLTGLGKLKLEKRLAQIDLNPEPVAAGGQPGVAPPGVTTPPQPPASPPAPLTPLAKGSKSIDPAVEAELKKAGFERITGTWKKMGTNTYEGTDGYLEAPFQNGAIETVLDCETKASVCVYVRVTPLYKAGYGLVIRDGKTKTQVLGLESTVNGNTRYIYHGEPVEGYEIPLTSKERYQRVAVSVSGQNIELKLNDKREQKNLYPKMAPGGTMRIVVHGTATIVNPRGVEIK